jgi:hypothetical protein
VISLEAIISCASLRLDDLVPTKKSHNLLDTFHDAMLRACLLFVKNWFD